MYDAEHSRIARQCVTEYLEKNSETTVLLKEAFEKALLGDSMICRSHKAFVNGRESAEFELQGGALRTVVVVTNINTITTVIEEDRHLTVRALAEVLDIPCDTESEDSESVMEDEKSCFFISFFLLFLRREFQKWSYTHASILPVIWLIDHSERSLES